MKKNCNKFKEKMLNNSGASLLEMLCAILILLLVSGGMASGVSLANRQYDQSIRASESQILYSTLETVLKNELAYTTQIIVDSLDDKQSGSVKQFLSQNFAIKNNLSTIMTDNSGTGGYGQLLLGNSVNPEEKMNVLSKAAYTKGLLAMVTSITYSNTTHYFTVYLSIGYNGTEYYGGEFQVKNVNETTATVADGS